ncbi:TPA: hypothetical protein N0F65_000831 [Lagenidium giganteum]|uniref:DDE-1 domain-containing protein n=1 Tax=Lagenidium giganteum TaxID=4803 RepID=A0AAV2YYI7_9STRA|nr:TPA: hypothetical protein N0F65_000831 [Lagenidium giganteum]
MDQAISASAQDVHALSHARRKDDHRASRERARGVCPSYRGASLQVPHQSNLRRRSNWDQPRIPFEANHQRKGEKSVCIKCGSRQKERLTAMLLDDSDGNKYPLFLVLKAPKSAKDYHFKDRPNPRDKILMLLDAMNAHFTTAVEHAQCLNVLIEKIPANFTWYCQPADLAWIKPLKDSLRRQWVFFLRDWVSA